MNSICRYLGFFITISLISLALTSCESIRACEVQSEEAEKISVNSDNSIYSQVFGSQSCSPQKLVLRVPVNLKIESQDQNDLTSHPKIATFITFSRRYQQFYVRRIDEYKDGWFYTEKDSCLSWKWSKEDEQQVLNLSMERNLQIQKHGLKSIIFIVSLPVEIKEEQADIILKRYTWDKEGGIYKFDLEEYPILKEILKQKEKQKSQDSDVFYPGGKTNDELTKELESIGKAGGLHIDEYVHSILESEQVQKYTHSLNSDDCGIPEDF